MSRSGRKYGVSGDGGLDVQNSRVTVSLLVGCLLGTPAVPALAQVAPIPDAGAVLGESRRDQQAIERRNAAATSGPAVIGPVPPQAVIPPTGGATFRLNRVVFDPSQFITPAELEAIAARYVGRDVDDAGVQQLLKAVNDLYAERRVITALAYLPAQDLRKGELRIAMVEGRLGKVDVQGNTRLPTEAATTVVTTPAGGVVDVPALERDVAWFNKTRSAQIQASLQPGANFGLTDIHLAVLEPPTNQLQIFTDDQGVEAVGQYQLGTHFQRNGLFGLDDKVTGYGVVAEGNLNGNLAYSTPFNPWGGRIGVSGSMGSIRVYRGAYADLHIRGRSESYGVNLSQPLWIDGTWALLANAAVTESRSRSRQSGIDISDDITRKYTLGATLSYTGRLIQASLSPNWTVAETRFALGGAPIDFHLFGGTYSAVLHLPWNFSLSVAGSGQWSDTTSLASDQLFQIGGPTTVRGYPTSGVAGHSGYTAAFELHRSLGDWVKGLDLYGFVDTGTVWATHPSRITLTSVGAGVTWDHDNRIVSDLSVAAPTTTELGRHDPFVYYRLTVKFE